jgi:hypothetical protein
VRGGRGAYLPQVHGELVVLVRRLSERCDLLLEEGGHGRAQVLLVCVEPRREIRRGGRGRVAGARGGEGGAQGAGPEELDGAGEHGVEVQSWGGGRKTRGLPEDVEQEIRLSIGRQSTTTTCSLLLAS